MVPEGQTVITGGPVETEKSATAAFDPPPIPPPSNPIYKPSSDERLTAATIPLAPPSDAAGAVLQPVAEMLRPVAIQAATEAAAAGHAVNQQLIAGVASDVALVQTEAQAGIKALATRVAANEGRIEDALAQAGAAVMANLGKDQWLQRAVVLLAVGGLIGAALGLFGAYLVGAPAAKGIVAWALLPSGALTLLVAKLMGWLSLPTGGNGR